MNTRPDGLPPSIEPRVSWRRVARADVLQALHSLDPSIEGAGRLLSYRGEGVETLLSWSRAELERAEAAQESSRRRHATQAVGHARRALDCLMDAYLERECLAVRLPPRANFNAKLRLLAKRPNLRVPTRLVPTIISGHRNAAEHRYESPSFDDAALAVEAAETVVPYLREQLDPLWAPVLHDRLAGGHRMTPEQTHHWFTGFPDAFALLWRQSDGVPRLGVGCGSQTETEIIACDLADLTEDEHFEVIGWWDSRRCTYRQSEASLRDFLELAGMNTPPP